ncbi:MAG TPA: hypothetical protein VKB78_14195 [Pirellulales bacterium]|nr:hypothetical protein [Pirellulales bacterium]
MSARIALTELRRELARVLGESSPRPSYPQIYACVLDGIVPAERTTGRWYVRLADVPRIAEILRAA